MNANVKKQLTTVLIVVSAAIVCGCESKPEKPAEVTSVSANVTAQPTHKPAKRVAQKPKVQKPARIVGYLDDDGGNATTATVCTNPEAVTTDTDAKTPGCTERAPGNVIVVESAGSYHAGSTTYQRVKVRSLNGAWQGYVLSMSLKRSSDPADVGTSPAGLPDSITLDSTPPATPEPTVFKMTQQANAFHNMDICVDGYNAMGNDGALTRMQKAFNAGEYDTLHAGDEVTLESGDLEKDIFVMVRSVAHGFVGCVSGADLQGVR